ncbi:hypothetical protein K450DRAFT_260170 [Umbelopsis ramanniana AG]|uniref:Uncharacterized protein n=1 Tax=Umbelopsis ramanniana AG TaxID=1314678 RepID=A0AAD5E2X1_UMBRA|nr:uncharacterized protein K450DRAFT_260170 [Umbelopsis ramanniana AG]KAI8575784.1 hypothetical protein K450DRAFT_260170 [Umbelopsis ramanniana AG]
MATATIGRFVDISEMFMAIQLKSLQVAGHTKMLTTLAYFHLASIIQTTKRRTRSI